MIDVQTCEAWLREQRSRALAQSFVRMMTAVCGAMIVFILQFSALALAAHYFASLALVRLLNLPPDDPVNRTVLALARMGWTSEKFAAAAIALLVFVYLVAKHRGRRERPVLLRAQDSNEPTMLVPQTTRAAVQSDLSRSVPHAFDHLAAIVLAVPRLTRAILAEFSCLWRLFRIRLAPCAEVVASLFGRESVELCELELLVGRESLAEALPCLWDFPAVRFHSGEKDALSLGPVATSHLLGFGVI